MKKEKKKKKYGLKRVGDELGDDPASSSGEAIDQSVWHIFFEEGIFYFLEKKYSRKMERKFERSKI